MPSEAALDEAARVTGMVVWLTSMPSAAVQEPSTRWEDGEDELDVTPCEAVVFRNFLGRYDLVKIISA